ncbi:ribosome maturation factor RimM [Burkholderia pseudomultivorans]|uniref:Ribosome maturation factor RimM n=1 Tax=Burkholderia pseudomultivorans TaxID=1207504 RepID=A0A132EGT6_9BURK|nr:ribosome maturation factor RimM [Burkholderia pseudomultivorans]KWF29645.1 16S rRNA processing protein RimM [Burkholderia pseudomultivorans]MDR8731599.1 Ribosome maturation factor RimM [Burkholderia pseudomultivorans]MDR8733500.1 Ribosome maturation factor RimM [Burkholderia pseudomultivorans]MDR8740026.1 Ribosome maturation factor RimM [Burkholderia pseudomultivorans]MDR8756211.1 Ribosome maturation factor RimM [Burkholderia pseudomultivorans]
MSDHDSGNARRGRASFGAFVRKPVERGDAASAGAAARQDSLEAVQTLPDDAVEVGAVVDAYGLKGWLKVAAHADAGRGGDALLKARRWWLEKGAQRFSARIMQSKTHGDTVVAQPAGVSDRDAALALRGFRVFVRREDFPALAADEFYWVDLIGLEVVNEQSVALGKVAGMIDNSAHSIMRVEYPSVGKDGRPVTAERLIPFVGVYVKTVDQAARRIVVDWEADY